MNKPTLKPKHLAGTTKVCSLPKCQTEILLHHAFCPKHHGMLPRPMMVLLAQRIKAAQTGATDKANAMRDYVRVCCTEIVNKQIGVVNDD